MYSCIQPRPALQNIQNSCETANDVQTTRHPHYTKRKGGSCQIAMLRWITLTYPRNSKKNEEIKEKDRIWDMSCRYEECDHWKGE